MSTFPGEQSVISVEQGNPAAAVEVIELFCGGVFSYSTRFYR